MTAMTKTPANAIPLTTSEIHANLAAPMKALAQLQRALDVARPRTGLLRVDAALPYNPTRVVEGSMGHWSEVAEDWRLQIDFERLEDVTLGEEVGGLQALAVDPRDGAWTRGRGGLAYLPAAFGQAVSLLLTGVPRQRGTANVLHHDVGAPARCLGWEDLREKSPRRTPAVLRTYLHPTERLRTVRGVLSQRYPVGYFDDRQVMAIVGELARPDAYARVWRSPFETRGSVTVGPTTLAAEPVLSWRNSETGKARLGFFAGLRIVVLDEVVTLQQGAGLDVEQVATYEKQVTVAVTRTGTERNHTLPWSGWTEEDRRALANARMRASRNDAACRTLELQAAWAVALEDFPLASGTDHRRTLPNIEVLLDVLEELGRVDAKERDAVGKVMHDTKRLPQLGLGSAAYMAGVFAILARQATDLDAADEMNARAYEWIIDGWRGEGGGKFTRRARVDAAKTALAQGQKLACVLEAEKAVQP